MPMGFTMIIKGSVVLGRTFGRESIGWAGALTTLGLDDKAVISIPVSYLRFPPAQQITTLCPPQINSEQPKVKLANVKTEFNIILNGFDTT